MRRGKRVTPLLILSMQRVNRILLTSISGKIGKIGNAKLKITRIRKRMRESGVSVRIAAQVSRVIFAFVRNAEESCRIGRMMKDRYRRRMKAQRVKARR